MAARSAPPRSPSAAGSATEAMLMVGAAVRTCARRFVGRRGR
jgi:hypothetical protein